MKKKTKTIVLSVCLLSLTTTIVGVSSFLLNSKKIEESILPNENIVPTAYIKSNPSVKYTSIEKALKIASLSSQREQVFVIPGTNPTITKQCTIGENVDLIIPYENETYFAESSNKNDNSIYNNSGTGFADNNPQKFRKNSLKITKISDDKGNILPTLTIEEGGSIKIGGMRGREFIQGGTSGAYCELVLEEKALIKCEGTIECHGFIKETYDNNGSLIDVSSTGIIKEPLCIYDWVSGSFALSVSGKDVFPFNLFDFAQISPIIKFNNGSKLIALIWIYGSSFLVGDKKSEAIVIGSENDDALIKSKSSNAKDYLFFKNIDNSSGTNLTKMTTNHLLNIQVFGNYVLDKLIVNLTMEIDSSEYFLPFSYIFNITLNKGSTFDINSDIKFMPGAQIVLNQGAIANLNSDVIIYSSNTNHDNNKILSYSLNTPALFTNDGQVNINKNFGGKITAGKNGSSTSFINVKNMLRAQTSDVISTAKDVASFIFDPVLDIKKPGEETISKNSPLEPNQLYFYEKSNNDSYWIPQNTINKLVNFSIKEPDEGYTNDEFNYYVTLNKLDDTQVTYNNPTYFFASKGETFTLTGDEGVNKVLLNSIEELDWQNKQYSVGENDFNFTIVPVQLNNSKIESIEIERYDEEEGKRNNANYSSTKFNDVTLKLRAKITNVSGESFYSPETTFTWSMDGNIFSNENEPTYTFKGPENEEEIKYTVKLDVIDGVDGTTHSDDMTVTLGEGCFTPETLILLSDGQFKMAKDITYEDRIMTFNHFTGKFEGNIISYLDKTIEKTWDILSLVFDNGTKFEIISKHGLFDLTLNKYVQIDYKNVVDFIGHDFVFVKDSYNRKISSTKLIKYEIFERECCACSIASAYHLNAITNNMLSMTDGIDGLYNIFEYDKNLLFDKVKMKKDIEKYGLLKYEELSKYLTKEQFDIFGGKHLKISIGKGLVTMNKIIEYINQFLK